MKLLLTIVSGLMILVGVVWILQGVNILPGSFMTGHIQWAINGALVAALGAALLVGARRLRS